MSHRKPVAGRRGTLVAGLLASSALASAAAAQQRTYAFDLQAEPVAEALRDYGKTADRQLIFAPDLVRGRQAHAVQGRYSADQALDLLLSGTDLTWRRAPAGGIMIVRRAAPDPQPAAAAGYAQTEPPQLVEEVLVTGTKIRGVSVTPSPVLVMDRDEIQRRGYASVPELLASVPQNFSSVGAIRPQAGTSEQTTNYSYATGVNLRGLGAKATLTLVDGRRLAPTGVGLFVDSSAFPIAAVERVEILSDGASATYGSDAVAGVINYILRRPANEAESRVRVGAVTEGGYRQYDVSQTLGHTWGGGGVILAAEFLQNTSLDRSERDFSRRATSPAPLVAASDTTSIYVGARQDLPARTILSGKYLYSLRDTHLPVLNTLQDVSKNLHAAEIAVSHRFGDTWSVEASVSRSDDHVRRDILSLTSGSRSYQDADSVGWYANLNASGALWSLPGGPLRAAVGAEFTDLSSSVESTGRFLTDDKLKTRSAFAELQLPIVGAARPAPYARSLILTAAVRLSDYEDFGSVANPKLGFLWDLNGQLRLRGTWGTSFRAPSLHESSKGGMAAFVNRIIDPFSPTGRSRVAILEGSNPDNLEPEESENWTAGVDFRPAALRGLEMSVTYFDYDFENKIEPANPRPENMLANPALYSRFLIRNPTVEQVTGFFSRSFSVNAASGQTTNPAGVDYIIDRRPNNLAKTRVRGLDFDIQYGRDVGGGRLHARIGGAYYFEYKNFPIEGGPGVPGAGVSLTPTKFRARGSVGYARGPWSADLAINYIGSYVDRLPGQPDRDVEAWAPVDLRLAYEISVLPTRHPTRLALIVHNAFDEAPPFIRDVSSGGPLGYDALNANPLGRVVSLELAQRW